MCSKVADILAMSECVCVYEIKPIIFSQTNNKYQQIRPQRGEERREQEQK